MARKAVQGYTEKSFYDNTKFNGVVATNDPLQEGFFKHLVNLDISDTGQSVKPRKGFLTTTIRKPTALLSLSKNTILIKDHSIEGHIIYDFNTARAFIADISGYNLEEKLLPIDYEIANIDWSSVVTFLKANIPEIETYSNEAGVTSYDVLRYVRENVKLYTDTKIKYIIDEYNVKKALVKVYIEDTNGSIDAAAFDAYPFFLEVYYRETENDLYAADTLVFDAVDLTEHITYDPSARNIASPNSIIPVSSKLQILYTDVTRPSGHISSLGLIYCKDVLSGDYYSTHVYKNKNYEFTPHFSLDPAKQIVNDVDAEWAYYFEVYSSKDNKLNLESNDRDIVYRSGWHNYGSYSKIFPLLNTIDLTNEDKELRHYKNTRYMIHVVPKSTNSPDQTYEVDAQGNETDLIETPTDLTSNEAAHDSCENLLDDVNSLSTLRAQIKLLGNNFLFYVVDLRTDAPVGNAHDSTWFEIIKNHSDLSDEDGFNTAEDMLDLINSNTFDSYNWTFHIHSVLFKVNRVNLQAGTDYDTWYFSSLDNWGTYNTKEFFVSRYNLYEDVGNTFGFNKAQLPPLTFTTDELKTDSSLPDFEADGFFNNGYIISFYMVPYVPSDVQGKTINEVETLKRTMLASAYSRQTNVIYGYDDLTVNPIVPVQETDPVWIQTAEKFIVFNKNRLVVWKSNTVYISEPGEYNYFKDINKKEFREKVIKVLEYKNILLVFTAQHLYAIYEDTLENRSFDEDGTEVITTTSYWASQCVLYNIMAQEKYADVIQVFNQMVLFYSADGQMYLIKPNTMIDSETRFTLKYFNKAVNDVLLNYDIYINERLANYNIDETIVKEQVRITALTSVNYIKIFYYVPGYITYILVYDVLTNRYYMYDTLTFTEIKDVQFIESGDLYITEQNDATYFTMEYVESRSLDNNVDMSFTNNFKKIGINALLDTGNFNLNNHLRKRFLQLVTVFKNISAKNIMFNIETVIDDIVSHPYFDTQLEVQDVGGVSYFVSVPAKANENDLIELVDINQVSEVASNAFLYAVQNSLFEENNLLMDFSEYTSSKLLTHKSSILDRGKVFRLKLQFISKGVFKLQSFGIVYKERRI